MSESYKRVSTNVRELRKYAELEGSEMGELALLLCDVASYIPYMTEEFSLALDAEIVSELFNFVHEYEIVEREETTSRTYLELCQKTGV